MKEHPILFSEPMVRAILDGRKTQTRRVVKNQPGGFIKDCYARPDGRFIWLHLPKGAGVGMGPAFDCSYGVPGHRLWVRETWCHEMRETGIADGVWAFREVEGKYRYRSDGNEMYPYEHDTRWKPSIHLPRKACRIILDITNVRVERLRDITEEDAKAEGAEPFPTTPDGIGEYSYRDGFRFLWDSINAKRGFGWEANPWVWVIEFTRSNNAST